MRATGLFIAIFFSVITASSSTFAATKSKGKSGGWHITPGAFASTSTQNNGSGGSVRKTSIETNFKLDVGYQFDFLYAGLAYFNGISDQQNYAGANTQNTTNLQYLGPVLGILWGNLSLKVGYIVYSNSQVFDRTSAFASTTYSYSSGTGPFGSISYQVNLTDSIYLAPTIDLYSITYTIGQLGSAAAGSLTRNYEVAGFSPFLSLGLNL